MSAITTATDRPSTAELYDAYALKNYAPAPITLVRGQGARVWDDEGRSYLDFATGIAVNALGHGHPRWVAAMQRQAAELVHVSNLFRNPRQGELARRLVERAGPGRVFFCNSGTEANEAMIKLSRLHGMKKSGGVEGKCHKIICAKNAFHGRAFGGMSATPQEKVQKGFAPLVPGFVFAGIDSLDNFAALVDENTAAILVEPIQGESGVRECPREFLAGLRALCDRHDLLLMLDEVQCGVGRTGKFFAFEHAGIRPDAVGMAKGLGGGMPIGAMWVRDTHAGLFHAGHHGSTFGGNPLACAAGLAVLDAIENEDLLEKVASQSVPWMAALGRLASEFPQKIAEVRGRGYLVGVQLTSDTAPVIAALRSAGLLVVGAGGNTIRLLPPLTVSAWELSESVEILRAVLSA